MRISSLLLMICFGFSTSVSCQFRQIQIGDAEINYIDRGSGSPVVFVHGGMEDYRTWVPQLDSFSRKYRVIDYSRRFNYPNQNKKEVPNFSAETEAEDLAKMIIQLKLQPVHLVGHSYGAQIALTLAIKYPQLLYSLTLSEPPVISWLPGLEGGQKLYDAFFNDLWKPVKQDFEQKDTPAVLRHTIIYFYGSDLSGQLTADDKAQLMANVAEWRAIAYSTNAFPAIQKKDVSRLPRPVLLLSAGQTIPVLKLTNAELRRLLPNAQTFQLADGTHDYWVTNPVQMGGALMHFLNSLPKK
ncbi:MAG TPA: alpha/beta hydrolase [Puia sp.]|nr:alpha/beta hydrolase [Puia sp.]